MHIAGERHGHKEYTQHERIEHPDRCLHAAYNHGVEQVAHSLCKESSVAVQTCRNGLGKQSHGEYHPQREL